MVSLSGSSKFLALSLFKVVSSSVNRASPFWSVHGISLQVSWIDMVPLEVGFDRVFIPQFWSSLVSFAGLEFPVHQASRHLTLLHALHLCCESTLVEEGTIQVVTNVDSLLQILVSMGQHTGGKDIEEDRGLHAAMLHAVADHKSICHIAIGEDLASHAVMEEPDHRHQLWRTPDAFKDCPKCLPVDGVKSFS